MKTILQNKQVRKTFLFVVALILLLILIVRFWIIPNYETSITVVNVPFVEPIWITILTKLLDSLFVSLTVTVCIGLFLFYIELPDDEKKFEIIEAFKIKELFANERRQTEIWFFSGGIGRHTRAVTIPELAKIAQTSNQHKNLKLQVIDPTDELVCSNYANYRRGLNSASKNSTVWTKEFVRQEIIATIVSGVIHKSNYPLLDLSICLKNNFSTLRIDLSSNAAIITKEEKKEPALVCKAGSFLYRTYKEEILQTFKEYSPINTSINFPFQMESVTMQEVKSIATSLGIANNLTDENFNAIAKILKENNNPYE